jgi:hypothetical protein
MASIRWKPKYTVFSQSSEIKKTPNLNIIGGKYRLCCLYRRPNLDDYPPITRSFTISNNITPTSISNTSIPIIFQIPPIERYLLWTTVISTTGGNGITTTFTNSYNGGKELFIYVGNPGTSIPGTPITYLPGGASAVLENNTGGGLIQGTILSISNGGNVNSNPNVTISLTIRYV